MLRAGLTANHLRAIAPDNLEAETIRTWLMDAGIQVERLEPVEPTLEDVFLALADTNYTPLPDSPPAT